MTIVQQNPDDPKLFQIVLDDQATAEQQSLKQKIDACLELLKKHSQSKTYQKSVDNLRTIATEAFDSKKIDMAAASEKVDAQLKLLRPDPQVPPPARGAFRVTVPDHSRPEDRDIGWGEIIFNAQPAVVPTKPQIDFKSDVEATLTVLQQMFEVADGNRPATLTPVQRKFAAYQTKLLGIAQVGLQANPDLDTARQSLQSLRDQIVAQEGPRVKNAYMRRLGIAAAISAAIAAIVYLALRNNLGFSNLLSAYRNLFVLWTGTMIGAWLSFGLRRQQITFMDLGTIEKDMIEPPIRLIFTGLIVITIGFIFAVGMVNVNIGGLNSSHLLNHGSSALLMGLLLGVSEMALPGILTKRASQFVSEIGAKA